MRRFSPITAMPAFLSNAHQASIDACIGDMAIIALQIEKRLRPRATRGAQGIGT